MIPLKPWWVMVRETGVGLGAFLLGTAVLIRILQGYSAWDDRRMTVRFQADTLRAVVPFVIDTAGRCQLGYWDLRIVKTAK